MGNPGHEYAGTYHNAGFRVVERIAQAQRSPIVHWCGSALISSEISLSGAPARLVLPQTYMNRSGDAAAELFDRFGAGYEDLIVVYDDVALPLGRLRVRQKGSAGGHNGIKSIISVAGSDEFMRVRIGIQPDREIGNVRDFVLSRVAADDWELLNKTEETAVMAVETLIGSGIDKAMAVYNGLDLREKKDM